MADPLEHAKEMARAHVAYRWHPQPRGAQWTPEQNQAYAEEYARAESEFQKTGDLPPSLGTALWGVASQFTGHHPRG